MTHAPPIATLFPYTTLFRSTKLKDVAVRKQLYSGGASAVSAAKDPMIELARMIDGPARDARKVYEGQDEIKQRSEEHTSELQSRQYLVCRLLLEKTKSTSVA